jgi:hypothetical protein
VTIPSSLPEMAGPRYRARAGQSRKANAISGPPAPADCAKRTQSGGVKCAKRTQFGGTGRTRWGCRGCCHWGQTCETNPIWATSRRRASGLRERSYDSADLQRALEKQSQFPSGWGGDKGRHGRLCETNPIRKGVGRDAQPTKSRESIVQTKPISGGAGDEGRGT